jgi:hypothetical protein
MSCSHDLVTPNGLRGVKSGQWAIAEGRTHFDGLCDQCKQDVWRHARGDEDGVSQP